jgi:hypothetical protein
MGFRIFSEHWVPDRETFMFRCSTPSATWTFCVDQQTLEELDDDAYFDRSGIFDAFRPRIYRVAATGWLQEIPLVSMSSRPERSERRVGRGKPELPVGGLLGLPGLNQPLGRRVLPPATGS